MLAEWVEPEVVGEDRISHGDVAGDALVEAALGEDAEGTGEVLFAVKAVFFGGEVRRVFADFEFFARRGFAEGGDGAVVFGVVVVDIEGRSHGDALR